MIIIMIINIITVAISVQGTMPDFSQLLGEANSDSDVPAVRGDVAVGGAERATAVLSEQPRCAAMMRFGKGRHGEARDRRALCKHMRARLHERRALCKHMRASITTSKHAKREARAKRSAKRKSNRRTLAVILDIAWGKHHRGKSYISAIQHDVSRIWAMTVRLAIASAYISCQNMALGKLVSLCKAQAPMFCFSRLAWDETGQKLTLQLQGFHTEQMASTWHVLVARLTLYVTWAGGGSCSCHVVMPPCILSSTSAALIHNGLFRFPGTKPILAARDLILRSATHRAVDLCEFDAATPNLLLEAYLIQQRSADDRPVSKESMLCRLHQQHLIEVVVLDTCSLSVVSRLYSFTLLLKGSGYFWRLVRAVSNVVADPVDGVEIRLVREHGPPDDSLADYSEEFLRFLFVHYGLLSRCEEQSGHNWLQHLPGAAGDSDSDIEEDKLIVILIVG
jgi:hypothetical protein